MIYLVFFFFFSSRRRHTRFSRDWSSDVCSSDLCGVDFSGAGYPLPSAGAEKLIRLRKFPERLRHIRARFERADGFDCVFGRSGAIARRDEAAEFFLQRFGGYRILRVAAGIIGGGMERAAIAQANGEPRGPGGRVARGEVFCDADAGAFEERGDHGVSQARGGELLEAAAAIRQRGGGAIRDAELRLV